MDSAVRAPMLPRLLGEHARVIPEWLHVQHADPFELRVLGIDEAIALARSDGRGHEEQTVLSPLGELIAEAGELRRGCGIAPVRGQLLDVYALPAQIFGNVSYGQD